MGKTLVLRPNGPFFLKKAEKSLIGYSPGVLYYMYDTLKVILFVFIESRTGLLL